MTFVGVAAAVGAGAAELLGAAGAAVATAAAEGGVAAGAAGALEGTLSLSTIFQGASLAWSIGSTLFSAIHGSSGITTQGPRLSDLHVQSAAFGSAMKRTWFLSRLAGELIWIGSDGKGGRGIREHARKITAGGKGKGGSASTVVYSYDADFAVSICSQSGGRVKGVLRIWAGAKLIYDVRSDLDAASRIATAMNLGNATITFYDGNEEQQPIPAMEALAGVGNVSAYRNQFIALFQNFDVTNYGVIPQFSFEVYTDGNEDWTEIQLWDVNDAYGHGAGRRITWSYVDGNGELEVMTALPGFTNYTSYLEDGLPAMRTYKLLADGSVIDVQRPDNPFPNDSASATLGRSDETAFMTAELNTHVLIFPDRAVQIARPPTELWAHDDFGVTEITQWHKKGNLLYAIFNAGYVGDAHVAVLNIEGAGAIYLQNSEAINSDSGYDPSHIIGMNVGENYMWVLRGGNTLLRIDLETLSDVQVYNLPFTLDEYAASLWVDNDDLIHFFGGATGSRAGFYEYVPSTNKLTTLGTAAMPNGGLFDGPPNLFIRNGIWYTGQNVFGIFDINVHAWAPVAQGLCGRLYVPVRDVCVSCGLDENEIDVSDLQEELCGYTLDQQMSGRDAILPLQRFGFFDGRESDLLLDFPVRGKNAVATIPEEDMAARPGVDADLPAVLSTTRGQETELPIRVHVRYRDMDADYETGHQYSCRLITESQQVETVDLAIVMNAHKARQISEVLMADHWLERSPKEIKLSRRYMQLDAADPVNLEVAA
jgi:hypothetical protein